MSRFARSSALRKAAAGTVAVGGAAYIGSSYLSSPLSLQSRDVNHPSNKRPAVLWQPPSRKEMLAALKESRLVKSEEEARSKAPETAGPPGEYDLLIIGGGATGTGVALDAASRGLKVALVERGDFSSGTSSKSTKLVHGGVRYLQKAVFELDYEQVRFIALASHRCHQRLILLQKRDRSTSLSAKHFTSARPSCTLPLTFPCTSRSCSRSTSGGRSRTTMLAPKCTTFWPVEKTWRAPTFLARCAGAIV